jgi:hypothetical protein
VCQPGYTGVDCSTQTALAAIQQSAAGTSPASRAEASVAIKPKALSLAVSQTNHSQAYVPPHKKHHVPAPTSGQFGIPEVNISGTLVCKLANAMTTVTSVVCAKMVSVFASLVFMGRSAAW